MKHFNERKKIFGIIVRNRQLARICLEYKQTWLLVKRGTCQFQFWEMLQIAKPQVHQFQNINGFIDSKNPVSIISWNQSNRFMGHLWIQTDHNLHHKCPHYGQSVTINMYDQTMISLESCSINYDRVWSAYFFMGGHLGFLHLCWNFSDFCFQLYSA